jgi:hypothetical protein
MPLRMRQRVEAPEYRKIRKERNAYEARTRQGGFYQALERTGPRILLLGQLPGIHGLIHCDHELQ